VIKLCVFQPFGERRGGSDNILLTTLRHLDRREFDPLVVFFGEGDFVAEVSALGIRTATMPGGRLRDPRHVIASARRVRALLRREEPDLILNWLSTSQVYAGLGAWLAGMQDRAIWWQLDLFGERAPERARLADRLATIRGQLLDRLATAIPSSAIGCCSESVRRAQAELPPRRPTFAVLPGIDPPPTAGPSPEELRRALSIPPDAIVVGIVGRLFAWKGHHLLLEAVARAREAEPGVHALVVGGGGHRPDAGYEGYLRQKVSDLKLSGAVTFTGQVPDSAPYMRLMDVFVNASAPEPFGLVVLEAMAAGVPVIAVQAGGPAEIVEDGSSGLLTRTNEPEDLAGAILRLATDAGLRGRLGPAGRDRYLERFTGERMTRQMEAAFARCAS
jgi:glycosyltransferase involved in cell wall biosynthesis